MTVAPSHPRACAEPGCKAEGRVQIKGNKAWFCFAHKPHGRIK